LLGKEVSRPIYISAYRSLLKGFPDLHFNVQNVRTDGSKVEAFHEGWLFLIVFPLG
jgi:hypothetical protein